MHKSLVHANASRTESIRRGFQAATLLGASIAPACISFQNPFKQYADPPQVTYPEGTVAAKAAGLDNPICPPKGPGLTMRLLDSGMVLGVSVIKFRFDDCTRDGERRMIVASGAVGKIAEMDGQPVIEMQGQTRVKSIESGAREPPRVSMSELLEMARGRKAVLFGDIHIDTVDDGLLMGALPGFKSAGFDTLALEWPAPRQVVADAYLADIGRKGAIGELIAGLNIGRPQPVQDFIVHEIEAAGKNSLNVLFFDDSIVDKIDVRKEAGKVGGKAAVAPLLGNGRTKTLFHNLERLIDGGKRLVVNTGFAHAVNAERITMTTSESGYADSAEVGPSVGYLLKKKYGDSQVLITSLSACFSSFLDVCIDGTPGTEAPGPTPPDTRK